MPSVPGCQSTRSMSLEVARMIRKKYPDEWPKYIRDKTYREKIRQFVLATSKQEWCDSVAGTCACPQNVRKRAQEAKTEVKIASMFPGAKPAELPDDEDRKDLQ